MPFQYPSLQTIQTSAIADIQAANLPGLTTLLPQSVLRILAYVIAAAIEGNYSYLDWISLQSVPFTATGEFLEAWGNLKNVFRVAGAAATGSFIITNPPGVTIPNGTLLNRADGFQYATNELVTLTGVPTSISFVATTVGSAGNASSSATLTFASPIVGLAPTVTPTDNITGGSDQELDPHLRTRILLAYQTPPQGGAQSDYVEWALASSSAVTRAWASAGGAGIGSVTVYTMNDANAYGGFPQGTNGGATDEVRIAPATSDLLQVANFLYPLRPATALVYSVAPLPYSINLTFSYLSPNTSAIQAGINSSLADMCIRIGSPLGQVIYPSDIYSALNAVPGLEEFSLSVPNAPVTIPVGYLATAGTATF
jgi:uncharacterized phage protein gp47/JayE